MPYPFPDPAVTPEFEAENGITYVWGGDKWVVKTFTSPTNYITPAVADTEYVRIDGTSTMVGDLVFNGNRSVKSTDGNIKLNASGTTQLAQGGSTKLTVNTDNVTLDTNLFSNYGIYAQNIFVNNATVATRDYVQDYAVPANGTTSTSSPFEVSTAIRHIGYNYFQKKGNSFYISCESGPTIFGVTTEDTSADSAANYFGKCTADNHIVNKAYLESVLPETLPSWAFRNSNTLGDNSTLDGLWSVQYVTTSVEGQVIIKAKNDTANIANGTIVTTMPANTRPKSMAVIPLTSRDGLTTAFAVFSNQDGMITIQNVQGVGSTRLEGMLAYPIHDA